MLVRLKIHDYPTFIQDIQNQNLELYSDNFWNCIAKYVLYIYVN